MGAAARRGGRRGRAACVLGTRSFHRADRLRLAGPVRAAPMGFRADGDIREIIEAFVQDDLGGEFAAS